MLTVLDLLAGAGGLSGGLEEAGMDVIPAAELDSDVAVTVAKQHSILP
jgi:site-specific DNA-cytosine methylase